MKINMKKIIYNAGKSGSPDIITSGATVKVYNGNSNEPAFVFSVPLTGDGRYWTGKRNTLL